MSLIIFQSHKKVRAKKITTIYSESCVGTWPDGRSFTYTPGGKPTPSVGWYVVCYDDGHVSFSPPEAFEGGYSKLE